MYKYVLIIVLIAMSASYGQFYLSGESHISFSRSKNISSNSGEYIFPYETVNEEVTKETWAGWSISAGYLFNDFLSLQLTCVPSYSINKPRNNVSYSRWGNYNEKVEQSVSYNLPVYAGIHYHFKAKIIKPRIGVLCGLSIEKMSSVNRIIQMNEPPETVNTENFKQYLLLGTDMGADWFFLRKFGITAGFTPAFFIKKGYFNFTGISHLGVICSL